MKRCKSCHAPISNLPNVKICIYCGEEIPAIINNPTISNWLITLKRSLSNAWKNAKASQQKIWPNKSVKNQ